MANLSIAQRKFSRYLAQLILWAYDNGYEITMGEVYRTKEQAELNAKLKRGIVNSLHRFCLAADLNLFKNGMYLTQSEEYRELGEYWKSLDPACNWGGEWNDGNHFSLSWSELPGVK
jgi:hypothetical protein